MCQFLLKPLLIITQKLQSLKDEKKYQFIPNNLRRSLRKFPEIQKNTREAFFPENSDNSKESQNIPQNPEDLKESQIITEKAEECQGIPENPERSQ